MNNTCGMCGVQIRADQSRCEDCWAEYAVRQAGEMLWPEAAIRANLDANRLLAEKIESANAEQVGGESVREQVLREGIALTGGDRNRTYGAPGPNLALQKALWDLYQGVAGDKHSAAHDAAMQHVFAKVARIASGRRGHKDNYVDAAVYLAIAYECDCEQDGAIA